MTAIVYAINTCSTRDPNTGFVIRLVASEPWDADDPFVTAKPELFSSVPPVIRRTAPPAVDRPIETATQVPGVKRQVKRETR